MKRRIGNFEHLVLIKDIRFLVRGLTVGEYIDLVDKDYISKAESFYKAIALECILNWDGLFQFEEYETNDDGEIIHIEPIYDEENQPIYIEYNEDNLNDLHDLLLFKLGKDIYHKFSSVSKEEAEKYQAFTRWMYYASGDEERVKNDVKTFECENCIRDGFRSSRKCGLPEYVVNGIKNKIDIDDEDKEEPEEEIMSEEEKKFSLKYKMPAAMLRKSYDIKDEQDDTEDKDSILRDYYIYKECPTSMIDSKIRVVAEKIYFAHKANIPFFAGGMIDQDNRFVNICQIINSECNKIEHERHKREEQEAKRRK